ncbi:MAG: GNAT family N-acetyltransferase, partial [Pseudomonadota bacterium]
MLAGAVTLAGCDAQFLRDHPVAAAVIAGAAALFGALGGPSLVRGIIDRMRPPLPPKDIETAPAGSAPPAAPIATPTAFSATAPGDLSAETYAGEGWQHVQDDIRAIDRLAFRGQAAEILKSVFANPENTAVVLRDQRSGRIVGYSYASRKSSDTAYIDTTVIHPAHQGQGLVGKLMEKLEEELRRRGFKYVERDALIENGYADSIKRHYGNRILEQRRFIISVPQMHFRISLYDEKSPSPDFAAAPAKFSGDRNADASLARKLKTIWESDDPQRPRNMPNSVDLLLAYQSEAAIGEVIPRTMEAAETVLDAIARERGVPRERVTVAVEGPGGNTLEVAPWLKLGAQVKVIEPAETARLLLEDSLQAAGRPKESLDILDTPDVKFKADVVTWIHPNRVSPDELDRHLRDGGYLFVQTDLKEQYVDPLLNQKEKYEVLLDTSCNAEMDNLFFPSIHARPVDTRLLVLRKKTNKPSPGSSTPAGSAPPAAPTASSATTSPQLEGKETTPGGTRKIADALSAGVRKLSGDEEGSFTPFGKDPPKVSGAADDGALAEHLLSELGLDRDPFVKGLSDEHRRIFATVIRETHGVAQKLTLQLHSGSLSAREFEQLLDDFAVLMSFGVPIAEHFSLGERTDPGRDYHRLLDSNHEKVTAARVEVRQHAARAVEAAELGYMGRSRNDVMDARTQEIFRTDLKECVEEVFGALQRRFGKVATREMFEESLRDYLRTIQLDLVFTAPDGNGGIPGWLEEVKSASGVAYASVSRKRFNDSARAQLQVLKQLAYAKAHGFTKIVTTVFSRDGVDPKWLGRAMRAARKLGVGLEVVIKDHDGYQLRKFSTGPTWIVPRTPIQRATTGPSMSGKARAPLSPQPPMPASSERIAKEVTDFLDRNLAIAPADWSLKYGAQHNGKGAGKHGRHGSGKLKPADTVNLFRQLAIFGDRKGEIAALAVAIAEEYSANGETGGNTNDYGRQLLELRQTLISGLGRVQSHWQDGISPETINGTLNRLCVDVKKDFSDAKKKRLGNGGSPGSNPAGSAPKLGGVTADHWTKSFDRAARVVLGEGELALPGDALTVLEPVKDGPGGEIVSFPSEPLKRLKASIQAAERVLLNGELDDDELEPIRADMIRKFLRNALAPDAKMSDEEIRYCSKTAGAQPLVAYAVAAYAERGDARAAGWLAGRTGTGEKRSAPGAALSAKSAIEDVDMNSLATKAAQGDTGSLDVLQIFTQHGIIDAARELGLLSLRRKKNVGEGAAEEARRRIDELDLDSIEREGRKGDKNFRNEVMHTVIAVAETGRVDAVLKLIDMTRDDAYANSFLFPLRYLNAAELINAAGRGDERAVRALTTLAEDGNVRAIETLLRFHVAERDGKADRGFRKILTTLDVSTLEKMIAEGRSDIATFYGKLANAGNERAIAAIREDRLDLEAIGNRVGFGEDLEAQPALDDLSRIRARLRQAAGNEPASQAAVDLPLLRKIAAKSSDINAAKEAASRIADLARNDADHRQEALDALIEAAQENGSRSGAIFLLRSLANEGVPGAAEALEKAGGNNGNGPKGNGPAGSPTPPSTPGLKQSPLRGSPSRFRAPLSSTPHERWGDPPDVAKRASSSTGSATPAAIDSKTEMGGVTADHWTKSFNQAARVVLGGKELLLNDGALDIDVQRPSDSHWLNWAFGEPQNITGPLREELSRPREMKSFEEAGELDDRYEKLLGERERLLDALGRYDVRLYDAVFLGDEERTESIAQRWLERARRETGFLAETDRSGIELFGKDMGSQSMLPHRRIEFSSPELRRQQIQDLRPVGGTAGLSNVRIVHEQPTLSGRLLHFLVFGKLDNITVTVLHELIHIMQHQAYAEDKLLKEAQAYLSCFFADGSFVGIIKDLVRPPEEKGLYHFEHSAARRAVLGIATLYGLGKSWAEIVGLMSNDEPLSALDAMLEAELHKGGFDGLDEQALRDIFSLQMRNERMKARLLLFQTIDDMYPAEARKKMKLEIIRGGVLRPIFYADHTGPRSNEAGVIAPCDEDFPYDPSGRRAGIIFGWFLIDGQWQFRFGRYEANGSHSRVALADTPEEESCLKDKIRAHAPRIGMRQKEDMVTSGRIFLGSENGYEDKETRELMRLMVTRDEARHIFITSADYIAKQLSLMLQELHNGGKGDPEKIGVYTKVFVHLRDQLKLFDLTFEDVDPAFAALARELETLLQPPVTE